jgi:hypothetical protein
MAGAPEEKRAAGGSFLVRLAWFAVLWIAGLAAVSAVALLIRTALRM